MRRWLAAAAWAALAPAVVEAQVEAGDAAWTAGRFAEARSAYERAVAADTAAVRAWYRLGILASWDNQLDSSLALLARARRLDAADPDLRFSEAQVLSWANRFDASIRQWDSLLAAHPARRDAAAARARTLAWANRFDEAAAAYGALIDTDPGDPEGYAGRAQVAAWRGDYGAAIADYRRALSLAPDHAPSLTGLAQVYHWQGRDREARAIVQRVLGADSTNREARQLAGVVRAATRPRLDVAVTYGRDSDDNEILLEQLTASQMIATGLRAQAQAGLAQFGDPFRSGDRAAGELGLSYAVGSVQLSGGVGARRLASSVAASRTATTGRASLAWRPVPAVSLGIGYGRYPFDETAFLVGAGLDVDAVDASAEIALSSRWGLSLGGGGAWLNDDNSRTSLLGALTRTVTPNWTVGVLGRTFGYDRRGTGYFSPDRYTLVEARTSYNLVRGAYNLRLSGGLGGQRIADQDTQVAWRAEARGGYGWATINRVEVFAGTTRNAATSAVGAFQYWTGGVALTIGL